MSQDTLNEREFELVNIVGANLALNQRDLSRHMDMSLGMTNMIIRRLISKGYIRIRQLNKRKVEYILTPKGFTEKTRKSIKYTLKTINSIGLIKERLKKIIRELYDVGNRRFYLLGESDLGVLVEMAFQDNALHDCEIVRIKEAPQNSLDGILLICKEQVPVSDEHKEKAVDFITELAKDRDIVGLNV